MTKLTPLSRRVLIKKLKSFGFEGPFSGGKHQFMVKGDLVLTLPNPHKQKIGIELIHRLLKQAKVNREEWIKEK